MNDIKDVEYAPIDDDEIIKYLGNDAKIIEYKQLKNYKNIDELLPNKTDFVMILEETRKNYGHWVCLIKYKGGYEYFDSLGFPPDDLKWISSLNRQQNGETEPLLHILLHNSGLKSIKYNKIKYQSKQANTCGRWDILRILSVINYGFNLRQFYEH